MKNLNTLTENNLKTFITQTLGQHTAKLETALASAAVDNKNLTSIFTSKLEEVKAENNALKQVINRQQS